MIDPTGTFDVVCVLLHPDKALDMTIEQVREYDRTRDPALIRTKANEQPTRFVCRCLSPFVVATFLEGAQHEGVRSARAFLAGCVAVILPTGERLEPKDKPQQLADGAELHDSTWYNLVGRKVGLKRLFEVSQAIITASSLSEEDRGPLG